MVEMIRGVFIGLKALNLRVCVIEIRLDDQKERCIRDWKTREKTDHIAEDWMEGQKRCGNKEKG